MRACCQAFSDGLAPPCPACADLLASDLFRDIHKDLNANRLEQDDDQLMREHEGMARRESE